MPDLRIESVAVEVVPQEGIGDREQTFAERLYHELLQGDRPVLGILREGRFLLDMLTVFEDDIPHVAEAVSESIRAGRTC